MLIIFGVIVSLFGLALSAHILPPEISPEIAMTVLGGVLVIAGVLDLSRRKSATTKHLAEIATHKNVLQEVVLIREERDHLATIVREGKDREGSLELALREARTRLANLEQQQRQHTEQDASALVLLSILQERGKFLDFIGSDLTQYSDEKVGKVARFVHQGCHAVLTEFCELVPVAAEDEGTIITLKPGFDATSYRLLGEVPARPPFSGKMIHRGWRVARIALPKRSDTTNVTSMVVFPAEVEMAV